MENTPPEQQKPEDEQGPEEEPEELDLEEEEEEFDEDFDKEMETELSEFDEDLDEEEEGEEEGEEELSPAQEAEKKEPALKKEVKSPSAPLKEATAVAETVKEREEILASDEIPLTLSIEIGRMQMSLKKLMELEPGNLIELKTKPEDGVDLILNGKKVARGELLRIGEVIGVRILEI